MIGCLYRTMTALRLPGKQSITGLGYLVLKTGLALRPSPWNQQNETFYLMDTD